MRFLLLYMLPALLSASFRDLVAARDGSAVFFHYDPGIGAGSYYRATAGDIQPVPPFIDITEDGAITALTTFGQRRCESAGSTCFTAPRCSASWQIRGGGAQTEGSRRQTTLRLSPDGRFAWMRQTEDCGGLGHPAPEARNGLFRLPEMAPVMEADRSIANERAGRRVITTAGEVLVIDQGRLFLRSAQGQRAVGNAQPAREAVVDANGRTVLYQDSEGVLHRVDLGTGVATRIGPGRKAAMSDCGETVAFIDAEGLLAVAVRGNLGTRRYLAEDFALSGDGRYVFIAHYNEIGRLDLLTQRREQFVEPTPRFEITTALVQVPRCDLVCYSSVPALHASQQQIVVLRGVGFEKPGWSVRIGEIELLLNRLSQNEWWFQFPTATIPYPRVLKVFNHWHAIEFEIPVELDGGAVGCFGALHEDFSGAVTATNPARAGEIVHVFFTGYANDLAAWGQPNPSDRLVAVAPPVLANPDAFDIQFAGLAPGLVGVQQLDLRVRSSAVPGRPLFAYDYAARSCVVPPLAFAVP